MSTKIFLTNSKYEYPDFKQQEYLISKDELPRFKLWLGKNNPAVYSLLDQRGDFPVDPINNYGKDLLGSLLRAWTKVRDLEVSVIPHCSYQFSGFSDKWEKIICTESSLHHRTLNDLLDAVVTHFLSF